MQVEKYSVSLGKIIEKNLDNKLKDKVEEDFILDSMIKDLMKTVNAIKYVRGCREV